MALTDQFFTSDPEAYKELFDHANDLIHIVLPDGLILYVNNAWEKHLGYLQDEVQGRSIYDFVYPDDRQPFIEYRHRVLNGEWSDHLIEVRLLGKSGKLITVEGSVSAKFTGVSAAYTRGIFRDISLRVEAERRLLALNEILRERENNLHQLLTHAPDAVIVIDQSSHIQFWNSKATNLFGWHEQEVLGRALSETIIPPQYREAHGRGMQRYLATGEAKVLHKPLELTALKRDGTEFYISLTISTTSQNGKLAFIAFLRDIDKEKRTALELEQKQLQLERSNESLEQFAHVASHDMKEPVRKIRLFTELLKSEALEMLSPRAITHINKIEASAARITHMIEGILAHSTVNATIVPETTVFLNEVVDAVAVDLELLLEETGGTLTRDDLPAVPGAPLLLYQLFYNLVNNSLKFVRPEIAPFIRIMGRRVSSPGGQPQAEIRVSDNGIGFSADQAEIIFRKFTRLHSKDKFEGTGLGLSLSRSIVERHGGSIHAEPGEDGGAVFTILLPL